MMKAYVAAQVRLNQVRARIAGLSKDESGAALVEYAMVVGLMAVITAASLKLFGPKIDTAFTNIGNELAKNTTK